MAGRGGLSMSWDGKVKQTVPEGESGEGEEGIMIMEHRGLVVIRRLEGISIMSLTL